RTATSRTGRRARGMEARGPQWGPRVGSAWNVSGDNKTVVRGGFGIGYERVQANVMLAQLSLPPLITVPRLFYGSLADLRSSPGLLAPVSPIGYGRAGKMSEH